MWQWEREVLCVCVCVRESFRIHSSIFNVSCCTSVAMYQNAVTWHALLYIKKRKEKKEQAASCPVFLYKCWLILGGGERKNLSLVTVSSTASTETHHLRSPKLHHFLLVNLIRLLMFQKECQFFCISAKAVQQFAHIWLLWPLHVAKMITVTLRTEYSNSVFAVCHIQMKICITVCGGGVVCSSAAEVGWRRRNWQGSWKQFSNYALCQQCRDLEEEGTGGDGWKAVRMREWDTEKHTFCK